MKVFDSIKNKNIDELAELFDKCCYSNYAPWWKWWDENYCKKCEREYGFIPDLGRADKCFWCELNGKCKYFQHLDDTPDSKQTIKMWLESEIDK